MALKPEAGLLGGLAVMTVVYAVHQQATPTQADIQALPAGTPDIDMAERKATWIGAGTVAGIALLAKDPTIFVMGSAAVIGMALWTRHSNWAESIGGRYLSPSETMQAGTGNTGPAPVETEEYHMFDTSNGFDR